jgi:hypothetical protein
MTAAAELRAIRTALVAALERVDGLLGAAEDEAPATRLAVIDLPRTKAVEWVLGNSDGAMRPVEIWAELRTLGRDDPKMEIQVTTFDLWQRGRIGKLGRGQYIAKKDEQ